MRQVNKVILVFFILSFLACKQGQEEVNHKAEEAALFSPVNDDEIAEVVTAFNKAMINRDEVALEKLCSDQLSYGHSSGLIQNKAEFIEDIMNGPFRFITISTPGQTIALDGDTAVVRHILTADATRDGEPVAIKIGNVQVYKKESGGPWRLLVRQAYKL